MLLTISFHGRYISKNLPRVPKFRKKYIISAETVSLVAQEMGCYRGRSV